jgi:hypothetical protein
MTDKVARLHRLTVWGRWLCVGGAWLFLAPWGLWGLRTEISLWQQHFTWTALRYAIAYNPIPSIILAFCLGITLAVLVWQCRNILLGLPVRERYRLEKWVREIEAAGSRHPLWRWVIKS